MREAETPERRSHRLDDSRSDRVVEHLGHLLERPVRYRLEEPCVELVAGNGGDSEKLLALLGQRSETTANRLAHSVGQPELRTERLGRLQATLGGEESDDLVREERISFGHAMNRRDELRRRRDPGGLLDQESDVARGEAADRDAPTPSPEIGEQRADLGRAPHFSRAVRADCEDPHLVELRRQEPEEVERRQIGRMHIIEDDD